MDLQAFGVKFDQYYLESSLYSEGRVEKTVDALVKAGKTYEQDGAVAAHDRRRRRQGPRDAQVGRHVHLLRAGRGLPHDEVGARLHEGDQHPGLDHHGTIARVRAGLQGCTSASQGYPDYVLHKMVTVMRDGQEVKMSKRAGSYVTVRDLIEWSGGAAPGQEAAPDMIDEATITRGRDAVRFFLISRKADTEFVFDIDLALKQNDENPVYYVQYAHARICSVLNELKARYNVDVAQLPGADLSQLTSPQAVR
jgi:arginyl-tRNA synthetase